MAFRPGWSIGLCALACLLVASTSNSSEGSGDVSTPSSTTPIPTPTQSVVSIEGGNETSLLNAVLLPLLSKSEALRFINSSIQQVSSWGTGAMAFLMPKLDKVVSTGQMGMLLFKSGQNYERFKNRMSKMNVSSLFSFLKSKVVVNLFDGVNMKVDGLGGLGEGLANHLSGSMYILRERTGGIPIWNDMREKVPLPTCQGTRVIRNQPFHSFNVEVQFDPLEPLVVIAYATNYLGIDITNCWATVENHGSMALLTDISSYIRTGSENASEIHPITHISINRHDLSRTCKVTLCSLREPPSQAKSEIRDSKPEKIVFEFLAPRQPGITMRRLMSTGTTAIKEPCSTGTKVVTAVKFETNTANQPRPGPYRTFCNGTRILNGYAPPDMGCFSVTRRLAKVQCPTKQSLTTMEAGDCSYSRSNRDCPKGFICLDVRTPGRGIVKVASEQQRAHEDCNKECSFTVKGTELTLTCPNGIKHSIVSSEIVTGCPLSDYGHLPLWVCRMSFRPIIVYTLFAWYFLGYFVWRLALGITCLLLKALALTIRFFRVRTDPTKGECDICGMYIPSKFHWWRHENCKNGRCPYCQMTASNDKLKLHVNDCTRKSACLQEDSEAVTISYVPLLLRTVTVVLQTLSKTLSKAAWFLGIFVIFYICIHPVYSLKDTAVEEDLWEKEVQFVEYCGISCIQGEDDCTCPLELSPKGRRHLLSLFPDPSLLKRLAAGAGKTEEATTHAPVPPAAPFGRTVTQKRVVDVTVPWGTLHVSDAYSPSYSGKHISLSWSESSSSGDHITVNGKSQAILKLEAGTGMMWEITSPKSSEKKRVFVSILDHTQVYNSRFLYATGDRQVESWMHGACTGSCPASCACTDNLCHHSEFDDFTNWRCNPTWCLSIGSGCACCALSVKTTFSDWFVSKWSLDYIESPVIACVETSPEDRICQEVSAGTMLQLGPISVQFSDPTGVTQRLPKEVAIFHKTPGKDLFDLTKKLHMADGRTMCDIQSCTHGPVGDLQLYDVPALFDTDHINLNPLSYKKGLNATNSWMSWAGVNSYYTCHPGHWPDCHSNGVVESNKEAFANLKNSGDPAVNYFFHTEQLKFADQPTLVIKGRPSFGAGQITALLDVQGLLLKAQHVKPEGLHMDISGCKGCYGCSQGFTCSVRVKVTHPDTYTVHLHSDDPEVVVPAISILAQSDSTTTHELRFYAAVPKEQVCFSLLEEDSSAGKVSACSAAELSPQDKVLLEHRRTLHSTSDANCTTGYFSCITSNFGSFFGTIGQLLKRAFGSWWLGVLSVILVVLLVLVLVFFGPQFLSLLVTCCRARRGYKKLVPFDELKEEWSQARKNIEEEKKKNKGLEDYIQKLSKIN
nr:glycoprotein precursor [Ji'an nairovirus]